MHVFFYRLECQALNILNCVCVHVVSILSGYQRLQIDNINVCTCVSSMSIYIYIYIGMYSYQNAKYE